MTQRLGDYLSITRQRQGEVPFELKSVSLQSPASPSRTLWTILLSVCLSQGLVLETPGSRRTPEGAPHFLQAWKGRPKTESEEILEDKGVSIILGYGDIVTAIVICWPWHGDPQPTYEALVMDSKAARVSIRTRTLQPVQGGSGTPGCTEGRGSIP